MRNHQLIKIYNRRSPKIRKYFFSLNTNVLYINNDEWKWHIYVLLTHWGRNKDKMAAILQTTCSNAFWKCMNFENFIEIVFEIQLTIFQHWFRKWLCANQTTSHYLNQWWQHVLDELTLKITIETTLRLLVPLIGNRSLIFSIKNKLCGARSCAGNNERNRNNIIGLYIDSSVQERRKSNAFFVH